MENTNDNYIELLKCPQNPYLIWKIEDNNGVCAENEPGYADWNYGNYDETYSLGYFLGEEAFDNDWIYPGGDKDGSNTGCGLATEIVWKNTTKLKAYQSTGQITVFYSGRKL